MSQEILTISTKIPHARKYHSFLYHDTSGCVLLFSGVSRSGWTTDLMDIWSYDVKSGQWNNVGICEPLQPDSSNVFTSAVYDSKSNRVIIFDRQGQTWAYHFEKNTWQNMKPNVSPLPRCGQGMAYDTESDRVIMFGGFGCKGVNDSVYADTWAYNYDSNTWTLMHPMLSPPARMYSAMADDSKLDRVVMWGGRLWKPLPDNAVWAYDFNSDTWTRYENDGGPAQALTYANMVYRTATHDFFLYGGAVLVAAFKGKPTNETWTYELSSNTWKRLMPNHLPPPLANHGMAYVPTSSVVILFGGELVALYSDKLFSDVLVIRLEDK